jgi:hypothetical protein
MIVSEALAWAKGRVRLTFLPFFQASSGARHLLARVPGFLSSGAVELAGSLCALWTAGAAAHTPPKRKNPKKTV